MIERYERADHTLIIDRTGPKPIVKRIPHNKPGVIRKVINLTKAAAHHVRAGRPIASDEQIAERFAVCDSCEFLNRSDMTCTKCGCGIKKVQGKFSKLTWADSHCPVRKW